MRTVLAALAPHTVIPLVLPSVYSACPPHPHTVLPGGLGRYWALLGRRGPSWALFGPHWARLGRLSSLVPVWPQCARLCLLGPTGHAWARCGSLGHYRARVGTAGHSQALRAEMCSTCWTAHQLNFCGNSLDWQRSTCKGTPNKGWARKGVQVDSLSGNPSLKLST